MSTTEIIFVLLFLAILSFLGFRFRFGYFENKEKKRDLFSKVAGELGWTVTELSAEEQDKIFITPTQKPGSFWDTYSLPISTQLGFCLEGKYQNQNFKFYDIKNLFIICEVEVPNNFAGFLLVTPDLLARPNRYNIEHNRIHFPNQTFDKYYLLFAKNIEDAKHDISNEAVDNLIQLKKDRLYALAIEGRGNKLSVEFDNSIRTLDKTMQSPLSSFSANKSEQIKNNYTRMVEDAFLIKNALLTK